MKYRSRMDITSAILEIAEEGAIKTKIMYRAFLSFPQLKEYLAVLTDQGMLEHSKEDKLFYTTEKGKKFLKMYREVDRMIPQSNMLTKTKM